MIDITSFPDKCVIVTDNKKQQAKKFGNGFELDDIFVGFSNGKITLTAETSGIKYIYLRFSGSFSKNARFTGDTFERGYGNFEWNGFNPLRCMAWYFLSFDGEKTSGYGCKTQPDCGVFFMADTFGITCILDARCGGMGVILSGKKINAAELICTESEKKPFDFAKDFCKMLCPSPVLPPFPVYGSNNWYYAYGNSSHEKILADADILVSLTDGLSNRPFMVIDDCWQPLARTTGAAGRPIENGNSLFPNMAALAKELKQKDVRPGIWFRPLKTHEKFLNSELLQKRDSECLDPTNPAALELIAEDVRRLVGWGYELIKYDFATYDLYGIFSGKPDDFLKNPRGERLYDKSQTNAMAQKALYRTIKENAGDTILIGCNVIGHLAAGLIHIHRSGDDTSGRCWITTAKNGVNTLAYRLPQNKAFFNIDADCVAITKNVPKDKTIMFAELISASGSPLFCSISPDALDEEYAVCLKKAFARSSVQSDEMQPLDWLENTLPEHYIINGGELLSFNWTESDGYTDFVN